MAYAYPNEESLVSKGLYRIVSDIIGPECIVKLRQQSWKLIDTFESCETSRSLLTMISGSKAEEYDFKSSDYDFMVIERKVLVLTDNICFALNKTDIPTVLMMETENVPLGFTLLRCIRCDHRHEGLCRSLVMRGNDVFVSSEIARESQLKGSGSVVHGPCQSGILEGSEYDSAYTLKCPFWPKEAKSFIYRSLRHGWPCFDVLQNICQDGCLLVPINSKQQTCIECTDLEWRISFSMAEKKLIHSMNHSQFLCYGLMKIFLNEVLKKIPEIGELLCSYFLKTAVFWEISEGENDWSPWNFFLNFHNVFRRIMNWVSIGYCPNFFIPEHNMFHGKIYGRQQRELMLILRTFHNEGYLCLLRCLSIYEPLSLIIKNPSIMNFVSLNEEDYVSKAEILKQRLNMIIPSIQTHDENILTDIMRNLCNTAALVPTSDEMTSAIKLRMNYMLQSLVVVILIDCRPDISHTSNRSGYRLIKKAESILKRSKTVLCMNMVHHAVCSYTNGNYNETIQTVHYVQRRLQREPCVYWWNLDGDMILGWRQQGLSYEAIVNKFIILRYKYEPKVSIEELVLESYVQMQKTGSFLLFIPPLVFLNFLLILSYTSLRKIDRRNAALFDLYSILHYDDDHHIYYEYKAISWEILGICQQICGDCHGAYQSYVNALNDKLNDFKEATEFRINSLGI